MAGIHTIAGAKRRAGVSVVGPSTRTAIDTTATITTASVTAVASGGSGSYPTYSWALSAQTGTLTVTAQTPAAASTTFRITGSVSADTGICNAICTVTDSLGAVIASNTCAVTITNIS